MWSGMWSLGGAYQDWGGGVREVHSGRAAQDMLWLDLEQRYPWQHTRLYSCLACEPSLLAHLRLNFHGKDYHEKSLKGENWSNVINMFSV